MSARPHIACRATIESTQSAEGNDHEGTAREATYGSMNRAHRLTRTVTHVLEVRVAADAAQRTRLQHSLQNVLFERSGG